jgi:hypothetical protein
MALADKKYTELYASSKKTNIESVHSEGLLSHMIDNPEDDPHLTSVLKEIKDLQDELDALRTEISANKDKTTFPGFGTTNSTALAGDTTTISISEQRAIALNTAKTTFPGFGTTSGTALEGDTTLLQLGTSSTTALAGDTNLVSIGAKTTLSFGDMVATTVKGTTTYTIVLSATTDFGGKTGSVTKSITLTLT